MRFIKKLRECDEMNLVIIGVGQLGSRHLQGLALLKESMDIYLVDPSNISLETSRNRFNEVDAYKNKNIFLLNTVEKLPQEIEFAIISTTSLYRLNSLKSLLNQSKVKYLLLEKFLFPYAEEYDEAKSLLENTNTLTYVNCARRQFSGYRDLKDKIKTSSKKSLIIKGDNWNLGSNAIHFLDLFNFLNNNEQFVFDKKQSNLIGKESKHKGYIEFNGTLIGKTNSGNVLELHCIAADNGAFEIKIVTDDEVYYIDEGKGIIKNSKAVEEFSISYQSQLTNKVYEQLKSEGHCHLTPFEEAIAPHLLLIDIFNYFLGDQKGIVT